MLRACNGEGNMCKKKYQHGQKIVKHKHFQRLHSVCAVDILHSEYRILVVPREDVASEGEIKPRNILIIWSVAMINSPSTFITLVNPQRAILCFVNVFSCQHNNSFKISPHLGCWPNSHVHMDRRPQQCFFLNKNIHAKGLQGPMFSFILL